MNLIENINNIPLSIRLKASGIVTCVLFFFSFFLQKNMWLNLTISLCIGSGYYWIVNMYPQFMLIVMVTNHYIKYFYKKWSLIIFKQQNCLTRNKREYSMLYNDIKYNKNYIFKFSEKHRSNDLIIFKDETDHDITDLIEPYLGPLQNFHGIPYTPADFNHKVIKVFRDGVEISYLKTFQEYDVFKLD